MLKYNWQKLATIFLEAKKRYNLSYLYEVLEVFLYDVEIFELFIREGADLKDTKAAREWVSNKMESTDFEDIQIEVIDALYNANFYRKKLEEIKNALTSAEKTQETPEN